MRAYMSDAGQQWKRTPAPLTFTQYASDRDLAALSAKREAERILAETEASTGPGFSPGYSVRIAEYHDGHGLALCGVKGRPDCQAMFCALAEALAAFVAPEASR